MSTSSTIFPNAPRLSIRELEEILTDIDLKPLLDDAFPSERHSTDQLRHFAFITYSIRKMRKELQRFLVEQERIFTRLEDDQLFTEDIHQILQFHRVRRAQRAQHPYRRPAPTT